MNAHEATVMAALRHGRMNARKQREIAVLTRLSVRTVQMCIESLRRHGEPIASGNAGCWKATTPDELAESNRLLHAHLRTQYQTLRAQQMTERRMRREEAGITQPELWAA